MLLTSLWQGAPQLYYPAHRFQPLPSPHLWAWAAIRILFIKNLYKSKLSAKDFSNFMPDCEYNYLSWSFGLAFVGVVMMYVTAVLFLVEAPIMHRKEIARELQKKQRYPMELSV